MFNINSVINRTLIYYPIFKILIDNIAFREDNTANTAYTTGDMVAYNSEFFKTINKDQQVFVIAHELMHITLCHLSRLEDRDMEVWNYATDAVINQILQKSGLPIVKGMIDCPDALSYSAEEYYNIVKSRPDCEELMKQYRHKKKGNNIASHEHWNEELSKKLTENLPNINEHNINEINEQIAHDENQKYRDKIQNQESKTSVISADSKTRPVLDWKSFLKRKKSKVVSGDYNLSAGYFDEDGIYKYPFELIRKSPIEILIDTSVSVDDLIVKAFLSECKNIFDDYVMKVGCFDTKFYGFQEIRKIQDLDNFKIEGRGGTDFSVAVNSFDRNVPIKIIFTDGYDTIPKNCNGIIWMIYGAAKVDVPGGQVFYIDTDTLSLKKRSR